MQDKIARILDANLNRAREGLRVVEELARMVMESLSYQTKLKNMRHQLVQIEKQLRSQGLISSRDVQKDPGSKITGQYEKKRLSFQDIGQANIRRSQEALRVLEEFSKLGFPVLSKKFKALRFQSYILESELIKEIEKFDKKIK